jgi:hypothetical protein
MMDRNNTRYFVQVAAQKKMFVQIMAQFGAAKVVLCPKNRAEISPAKSRTIIGVDRAVS